ncbi:hypothetical protein BH23CHL6_BH23CHL6_08530 [soil metagenome]
MQEVADAMSHQFQGSRRRIAWPILIAIAAITVSAVPVAAQAIVRDNAAAVDPQVAQPGYGLKVAPSCRYEAISGGTYGWTTARLRRIRVDPPEMWAMRAKQKVGWRFVVQRSVDDASWTVTYRSPLQKSTAYADRAASFTKMVVDVKLPAVPDKADVAYRVVIKAFWYRSDGTKEYKIRDQIDSYDLYVDGEYAFTEASCAGEIRQFFDGPTGRNNP